MSNNELKLVLNNWNSELTSLTSETGVYLIALQQPKYYPDIAPHIPSSNVFDGSLIEINHITGMKRSLWSQYKYIYHNFLNKYNSGNTSINNKVNEIRKKYRVPTVPKDKN